MKNLFYNTVTLKLSGKRFFDNVDRRTYEFEKMDEDGKFHFFDRTLGRYIIVPIDELKYLMEE